MTAARCADAVPEALRARLASALGGGPGQGDGHLSTAGESPGGDSPAADSPAAVARDAEACLAAGEALLAGVLRDDTGSREVALDLLAADALVTRAFERAADAPATLPALADAAMLRIARLAGSAG